MGGVGFPAIMLAAGAVRDGYSALHQPGSMLSLGAGGWVQIANFIVTGLLMVACAVGANCYKFLPGAGFGTTHQMEVNPMTVRSIVMSSLSAMAMMSGAAYAADSPTSLNASQIIFFVVYFLLGYLLYSSIAAALGAMVNSEQELQQLNMILVMPLAG